MYQATKMSKPAIGQKVFRYKKRQNWIDKYFMLSMNPNVTFKGVLIDVFTIYPNHAHLWTYNHRMGETERLSVGSHSR